MMALGQVGGVLAGYVALNPTPDGWVGVIAGNRFCKEYMVTVEEALQDAKKLFEREIR